jgi:hypothetical protein
VSAQPPTAGSPAPVQPPDTGSIRCPRCSATLGPEQDWCLECGAPARTRLAATPNWRVPTLVIAIVVLVSGALLAFAFVKLTGDDNTTTPSGTAPVVATQPGVTPPAVTSTPTTPSTTAPAPASTTAVPPASTTAVPPASTTAVPPASKTAVPPASTTAAPSPGSGKGE